MIDFILCLILWTFHQSDLIYVCMHIANNLSYAHNSVYMALPSSFVLMRAFAFCLWLFIWFHLTNKEIGNTVVVYDLENCMPKSLWIDMLRWILWFSSNSSYRFCSTNDMTDKILLEFSHTVIKYRCECWKVIVWDSCITQIHLNMSQHMRWDEHRMGQIIVFHFVSSDGWLDAWSAKMRG